MSLNLILPWEVQNMAALTTSNFPPADLRG